LLSQETFRPKKCWNIADLGGRRGLSDPLVGDNEMSRVIRSLAILANDEAGGEVIEYAIVAGLISIAAITVIGAFGAKVLARWNSVNSSM
jgi:Flp pilus assembly pilin Flp